MQVYSKLSFDSGEARHVQCSNNYQKLTRLFMTHEFLQSLQKPRIVHIEI